MKTILDNHIDICISSTTEVNIARARAPARAIKVFQLFLFRYIPKRLKFGQLWQYGFA